jgi:hypothetical protein
LITSSLTKETFPFCARVIGLLPVLKVPVEAKLTPEVAIWAAAVFVPVVSSAVLQAVSAAAKGIVHKSL